MYCLLLQAETETSISEFPDPVSVGPDPLDSYSCDIDDVTLYNQFFPGGPHLVSITSIDQQGNGKEITCQKVLSDVNFPPVEVTSEQIMDHINQHSLVGSCFQKEVDPCEYTHAIESEKQRRLSEGYSSAFSAHSTSPYVHFDECNCKCMDCSSNREGKLPNNQGTLDMEECQDQKLEQEMQESSLRQCISSPSSHSLPNLS